MFGSPPGDLAWYPADVSHVVHRLLKGHEIREIGLCVGGHALEENRGVGQSQKNPSNDEHGLVKLVCEVNPPSVPAVSDDLPLLGLKDVAHPQLPDEDCKPHQRPHMGNYGDDTTHGGFQDKLVFRPVLPLENFTIDLG